MKRCLVIAAAAVWVLAGCQRRTIFDGVAGESCEIHFSAGSLQLEAATKADVALEAGSTVRVVAYQRSGGAGQSDPALATDIFKAEATYKVQSDGTTLVPCDVDDEGVEIATAGAKGMELGNGTYDFYAYSPARKIEGDNQTVKGVAHGTDFLGAFVGSQVINRSSTSVLLLFEHECAKITFSVQPVEGGIESSDLFADSVVLHSLAVSPAGDYTIGGDLTPTVGGTDDKGVLKTFSYLDPSQKGKGASGSGIFLPKSAGPVPAEFYVKIGNARYKLTAELPSRAFEKGNDYRFTARVKNGSIDLTLDVLSWNEVDQDLGGFGGPNGTILVGTWGNVDWSGAVGTNPDVTDGVLEVGSWQSVAQDDSFIGSNGSGGVGGWGSVDSGSSVGQ